MQRILKLAVALLVSWCVMTMTHEAGHIVCGWATGGTLQQADLLPWHLPSSHFEPNPHPLITLWGGPLLGALVPVLLAFGLRRSEGWFVAHFCLLANGCYLALAWITGDRLLDTAQLLTHGAHPMWIGLYCGLTIGIGYLGFRAECQRMLGGSSHKFPKQVG